MAVPPDTTTITYEHARLILFIPYGVFVVAYLAMIAIATRNQFVFAHNDFRYYIERSSSDRGHVNLDLWTGDDFLSFIAGMALMFSCAAGVAVVTSLPSRAASPSGQHFLLAAGAATVVVVAAAGVWWTNRKARTRSLYDALAVAVASSVTTIAAGLIAALMAVLAVLGGAGVTGLNLVGTIAWAHLGFAAIVAVVFVLWAVVAR